MVSMICKAKPLLCAASRRSARQHHFSAGNTTALPGNTTALPGNTTALHGKAVQVSSVGSPRQRHPTTRRDTAPHHECGAGEHEHRHHMHGASQNHLVHRVRLRLLTSAIQLHGVAARTLRASALNAQTRSRWHHVQTDSQNPLGPRITAQHDEFLAMLGRIFNRRRHRRIVAMPLGIDEERVRPVAPTARPLIDV